MARSRHLLQLRLVKGISVLKLSKSSGLMMFTIRWLENGNAKGWHIDTELIYKDACSKFKDFNPITDSQASFVIWKKLENLHNQR